MVLDGAVAGAVGDVQVTVSFSAVLIGGGLEPLFSATCEGRCRETTIQLHSL